VRRGRVEKVEAIATRLIIKRNKVRLSHISPANGTKDIWKSVRELTSRGRQPCTVAGVSAESLNNQIACISTDTQYQTSERVPISANDRTDYFSEWEVFVFKYADDTYIIIPASNAYSKDAELDNVAEWAVANNLQLNRAKSVEIIFTDRRRKSETDRPPTLPDIRRVNSIKVLEVCFTNHLSMNDHIHDVIGSYGQSLHALKVLRSHGMNDDSLRDIYKAVVLAKW